jgi:hypothetical protein
MKISVIANANLEPYREGLTHYKITIASKIIFKGDIADSAIGQ